MDGLLLLHGPGLRPGLVVQGAALVDVAPTVLALLGVPIPAAMDGRVLSAAFQDAARAGLQVTYAQACPERSRRAGEPERSSGPEPALSGAEGPEMSPEDEEILRQHLRGMGYVA
jgi:hypothetical protein